jgi:hypothetical protein
VLLSAPKGNPRQFFLAATTFNASLAGAIGCFKLLLGLFLGQAHPLSIMPE